MSSIIAYFALGNGIYSMTKAAIEKFCDALRLEMKKFGVRVSDITNSRCVKLPAISNVDFHMRDISLLKLPTELKCIFFCGEKSKQLAQCDSQWCESGNFGQGNKNKHMENNI